MHYSPINLGKTLKKADLPGFVVTEALHKPMTVLECHAHEHACMAFLYRGFYTERVGSKLLECPQHSLLIRPSGFEHSNDYQRTGAASIIIEVKQPWLEQFEQRSALFQDACVVQHPVLVPTFQRIYDEFHSPQPLSDLYLEGLILEVLVQSTRLQPNLPESGQPLWLKTVVELIEDEFSRDLSLAEIAAVAAVHPSHLTRVFRQQFHCSIGEYVRRVRVNFAKRQLAETDCSLADIAMAAGFFDQSHFSNVFRTAVGQSPLKYRQANRKRSSSPKMS
ncbi:MAG: helix-turn-helix transcriptional regulator [Acidobacteria bacterium]|nr:helix-turn-helix transcriptional regulator [Acidobacteriota bacterium]